MDPINLQIDYVDGATVVVSTTAADLIAFESHFDMSVAKLADNIRLTHLFYLAWHVLKRTGETVEEFEDWAVSVSIVVEASTQKK